MISLTLTNNMNLSVLLKIAFFSPLEMCSLMAKSVSFKPLRRGKKPQHIWYRSNFLFPFVCTYDLSQMLVGLMAPQRERTGTC